MTDKPSLHESANVRSDLTMTALDRNNPQEAFKLAKSFAEMTGKTVAVLDADGEVIEVFRGGTRN